ncbi:MAG: hypothetical protein KKB94_10755, partial [Proteobacteria bacterium]|nr:hypothetical protein [Pseudomonadota bacterium]
FYREGYGSFEKFMFDSALLIALSKIDQYEAECGSYRQKYGMDIMDFESFLHKEKGGEDQKRKKTSKIGNSQPML